MSASIYGYAVRRRLEAAKLHVQQLEWLITQLPILNAPEDSNIGNALARLAVSRMPYAYLNHKTWEKLTRVPATFVWTKIANNCPTKFVPTDIVPEGGIVFTSSKMPGVEGL
jgi:hypothetical protein